ncbi:MAG: ornithine cyclodeaminase family protein [Deltaproteobacteria bacterium]|nr:ornithine cyclodeaminase family protein [Deltaproteobacteria bacterium]
MVLVLNNDEVQEVLSMEMCLEAMENTFIDLAKGKAVNRPRSHTYAPLGRNKYYLFKSMDGAVPRYGVHALRFSSDIVYESVVDKKRRREKLPALPGKKWLGLVMLFNLQNAELLAIIQDGFLQRMRVGATSGVAAKYLARKDAQVVGLFGTGDQAGPQILALSKVRSLKTVKLYSPNPDHARRFAREWSEKLQVDIRTDNPKAVVTGSDIVACATNSLKPVFDSRWLSPGTHVNAVAGYELDDNCYRVCSLNVVRMREASTHWPMKGLIPGEVKGIKKFDSSQKRKIVTLADVVTGRARRKDSREITVFSGSGAGGSSGLGVQFAFAVEVYKQAAKRGLGKELPLEWFTESMHP